jgi:site-specific recombinase XerD
MRRWDGLIDGYARQCETRGLAVTTVDERIRELTRFGSWMKRRRPRVRLDEVDGEMIVRYLKVRTAFHARATVAGSASILRGMGEYLMEEGVWQKNPLRWIKGPRLDPRMRLPRRVGRRDMERIWDEAGRHPSPFYRHLDVCALALLYGTGMRRGELARLDLRDWDPVTGTLRVFARKTGTERSLPLSPGVRRCLEALLPHRQNRLEATGRIEEPALLVNRRGVRLSENTVSHLIERCAQRAGVPRMSLHQFRHSCASDLLESGVPLPAVQKVLGHAVIASTMRYLQIADPQRVEAMKNHPINDFLSEPQDAERRAVG